MHSDGLPNEPKRSHLSTLHRTLASLNGVLLSQPAQVHRAYAPVLPALQYSNILRRYALPVLDGSQFTTPRVFRSGLTACDSQSALQQWSFSSSAALALPDPQTTRLFFTDPVSNASFCLTVDGDKQPVSVRHVLRSLSFCNILRRYSRATTAVNHRRRCLCCSRAKAPA